MHKLKDHFGSRAVEIWAEAKDPEKLVSNALAKAQHADQDELIVIVDLDDSTPEQIEKAISRAKKSKLPTHLIVSNECFEVWLLAHYQRVDPVWDREQLAHKLVELDAVDKKNPKILNPNFPVSEYSAAMKNAKAVGVNELGPAGSSAMGFVVKEFEKRRSR